MNKKDEKKNKDVHTTDSVIDFGQCKDDEYCVNLDLNHIDSSYISPFSNSLNTRDQIGSKQKHKSTLFGNTNPYIEIKKETEYIDWSNYSYDRHFGTHDWLAYIALKMILDNERLSEINDSFNNLVNERVFWTEDRIKLYLYATAAPDDHQEIMTYNGERFGYYPFPHLMRFDDNEERLSSVDYIWSGTKKKNGQVIKIYRRTKIQENYDPVKICDELEKKIIEDLNNYNFNYAVYRLGALSHYIGDCACMPHLVDYMNNEEFLDSLRLKNAQIKRAHWNQIGLKFDSIHNHFQNMISQRTDGNLGWDEKSIQNKTINNRSDLRLYDFFLQEESKLAEMSRKVIPTRSENAALKTARFTYSGGRYDNANYMFNNYLNIMAKNWKNIPNDWNRWEPETKNEKIVQIFLEKIQKSLEVAIINIASAFCNIIKKIE